MPWRVLLPLSCRTWGPGAAEATRRDFVASPLAHAAHAQLAREARRALNRIAGSVQQALEQARVLHQVAHAEELLAGALLGAGPQPLREGGVRDQRAHHSPEGLQVARVIQQQAVDA